MTEGEAQNVLDAAGGEAARIHFAAVEALPRWRRRLLWRLSPPYPCVTVTLAPGPITVSKPLEVPPGVSIDGVWTVPATEADQAP